LSIRQHRNMMVFDTAYTYKIMTERNLSLFVTTRDIGGFFDHVWTVHSVASLFFSPSSGLRYGRPIVRKLNERHTHIEGKIGRYEKLAWFPLLNFLFAQVDLIWFLLKLIKQNRIAIIRAECPYYNGILGLIISRIKSLPLIIGVWSNPEAIRVDTKKTNNPRLKWMWLERMLERFTLRRADRAIAGNLNNMDFILSRGVNKECTEVIRIGSALYAPHFVDPSKRDSGMADLLSVGVTGQQVLMCISRLESLKLTDHMIRAVACLKGRGLNIKALYVGDGEYKGNLVKLAEELGVSDQIVFCGNQDQDWICRVVPHVAVVVSPLTGRALAEAALGAAPIAAYDTDWQNEIIEHGITGELVPFLDYSRMANSIEKILKDKEYANKIGANVRERTLNMMDPKKINNVLIDLYKKLIVPKDF